MELIMNKITKVLLFCCVMIGLTIGINAQDDRIDDFSFEQQPLQEESTPYFAIGGGVNVNFSLMNYDDLNNHLNSFFKYPDGSAPQFDGPMLNIGGEGFTGLVYIQNFRVTIFSQAGSQVKKKDLLLNDINYTNSFKLETSMWGLSLDYAIVPTKKLAILPGLAIGKSNMILNASQTPSSYDWANFKPQTGDVNVWRNELEANYWTLKPQVNIEYAIANFIMFRLGVGYSVLFGYDWKYNGYTSTNNVPTGINTNGLTIQSGLFLGLFNY